MHRCSSCPAAFSDGRALTAHARGHRTVRCPVCRRPVGASGLGSHLAAHRRAAEREAAAPPPRAEPAPLRRLEPETDDDRRRWAAADAAYGDA